MWIILRGILLYIFWNILTIRNPLRSGDHQNMHNNIEIHAAQTIVPWPNHKHRRIFSPSIEKGSLTLTFKVILAFWPRIFDIRLVRAITCNGFLANNTKFEPNMYFGILSSAGIENGGHWPGPSRSFGHFDSEFEETTFNVALVYWFMTAPVWLYRIQIKFPIKNKVSKCYSLWVSHKIKGWKRTDIAKNN